MKKFLLVLLPLLLFAGGEKRCSKCALNKSEIRCNYYVAKKGDVSKISYCKEYADYLNSSKVYGKASWYYLLSKEPDLALKAAEKAVKMGESYAYEYMGEVYLIKGDDKKAKEFFKKFKNRVRSIDSFTENNFKILEKLYENFRHDTAKSVISNLR